MTQALGSYAGVVTRASGMHVQVLFDEDQQRYWFPADRVQHWLVSLDAGDIPALPRRGLAAVRLHCSRTRCTRRRWDHVG